jgi:hypothetical protein
VKPRELENIKEEKRMKFPKRLLGVTLILGIVSFLILIFYFLALTDIWHENGSPDVWHGQGPAAVEWKFISITYWPMLLFHIVFFIAAYKLLKR